MTAARATVAQGRATAQAVLDALIAFRAEHRYSPSCARLARELGRHPSSVVNAMARLCEIGAVTGDGCSYSSWVPTRSVAYPESEK